MVELLYIEFDVGQRVQWVEFREDNLVNAQLIPVGKTRFKVLDLVHEHQILSAYGGAWTHGVPGQVHIGVGTLA